jgi:hypothetical protein
MRRSLTTRPLAVCNVFEIASASSFSIVTLLESFIKPIRLFLLRIPPAGLFAAYQL